MLFDNNGKGLITLFLPEGLCAWSINSTGIDGTLFYSPQETVDEWLQDLPPAGIVSLGSTLLYGPLFHDTDLGKKMVSMELCGKRNMLEF